uniref:Latent transforming growth factor beta binding protein 3 n=1 Tax=Scleropages formosus TaxID=113540 RepID=A0A8C9WFI6_SCLFO
MPRLVICALLVLGLAVHGAAPGAERAPARERFKVVIAPLICKRTCARGQCQDTCEQGNNTTLIGVNGQSADTLTGPGFRVVVCPHTCMNGGVCSSRSHCLCPPGFTGRLCQFPLRQMPEAQAAQGNKQPVYTLQVVPDGQSPGDQTAVGRKKMAQTHSVFTLPLAQGGGQHSPEVQVNVRVHHTADTSVVIQPLEHSDAKPPQKTAVRLTPPTHKPRGRCFQETTPKQACSSNPLPGLTNQEDCCGSVGKSWGQNKCYKCPKLSYTNVHKPQTIIEDYGSNCPHGYKRLNSSHCQDINECTMQGVCQNGECLNTQGSFLCACKPGYVLDRTRCVVEVTVEQGQCFLMVTEAGQCKHALPTHLSQEMCCCTVGKAWGSNCKRCPQDGTASFNKICPAGKGYSYQSYSGSLAIHPQTLHLYPNLEQILRLTQTDGEQPGGSKHRQVETTFYWNRFPKKIYFWLLLRKICALPLTLMSCNPEMDECRLNRNICGHGECINGQNGFMCQCNTGYRPHAQRKSCVDENECESDPCGPGRGSCINTMGSYRCRCLHGYKLLVHHGKLKCIDVNECYKPNTCGEGGQCINLPGSYKCECFKGYRSKSPRQPVCEDINECLDPRTCPNAQCENTPGSYECVPCLPGHQAQGGVCYDINECQKRGVCLHGRCENLPGTYRCFCNEGFLPKSGGKGCRDIDECEDSRLCASGRCVNTEGSFLCQCYPGYQRTQEGSHCEDINECERPSKCIFGRCTNTMGSYRCECPKGFVLVNGRRCQDIDECAVDRSLCQPHGVCENRQGTYICVCNEGYASTEDKRGCEEVYVEEKKECYLNLDDTVFCDSVLATNVTRQECCCSVGVGWGDHCEIYPCPVYHSAEFHSLCPVGRGFYHEESMTEYGLAVHRDIDECVLFADEICKEGRCMNTQPGYECYCQQGFYYDSNLLECIGNCHPSSRALPLASWCFVPTDVDECHDESLCTNGRCINTRGSFYCTCSLPWIPDTSKKKCVIPTVADVFAVLSLNVNECQDPSYCKNGRCVNTPGSFHCICTQPLTFSAALKQCVYDDRTAAHKDVCFLQVDEDLICSMPQKGLVVTYSECCCHYGRGWGPECRTCPQRNSGIFIRLCEMHLETESDGEGDSLAAFVSYKPGGDSSEEDSDECSCANGRCVRSYLGTVCECNPGFRLDHSRTRCTDIDECAEPGLRINSCKNARCVNTMGSFKCFCKHGYVPARRPNVCVHARTQ